MVHLDERIIHQGRTPYGAYPVPIFRKDAFLRSSQFRAIGRREIKGGFPEIMFGQREGKRSQYVQSVTMVGILDALTRSRFIPMTADKDDRRKHLIELTP